jgi:hypothetical protein
MAVDLTKLTASAERITSAREAVLTFINGVPGLIRDAVAKDDAEDTTHIDALADRLEKDATTITDAIMAGTGAGENTTPPEG